MEAMEHIFQRSDRRDGWTSVQKTEQHVCTFSGVLLGQLLIQ
jgi:hypothetical protein